MHASVPLAGRPATCLKRVVVQHRRGEAAKGVQPLGQAGQQVVRQLQLHQLASLGAHLQAGKQEGMRGRRSNSGNSSKLSVMNEAEGGWLPWVATS